MRVSMPMRRTLARTFATLGSALWFAGCFVSINDYKATQGGAHAGSGSGGVKDGGAGRGAGGVSDASTGGRSGGGAGGAAARDGGSTGGRGASDASMDGPAGGGTNTGGSGGTNTGGNGGTNTGGSAGGPDASTGGAPIGCGLTELPSAPPRPLVTGLGEFSAALKTIRLGDGTSGCTDSGAPDLGIGLDLDEECNGSQRVYRAGACGGGSATDGPGGIDNQFGGFLNGLQCADPYYSSDTINNQIRNGEHTLLFTVSRYNFSPSDDDVTLTIRVGGPLANPTFTIADTWPIALLPGETVPFAFVSPPRSVYVTGGILVGKFDLMPLKISLGATTLFGVTLHGAAIRCRIEFVGSNPKLTQCVLAGAWRAQDLLASLGAVFAQDAGVPVCVSDPGFAFTQDAIDSICGGADLAVQPNRGCDAVSFGAALETVPVTLGAPQIVNRASYECPNVPDCSIPDQ